MRKLKACLFDLDGVIVDTAKYHFKAWRRLANELGFDFTATDNEQLKGISRMESLDMILKMGDVKQSLEEKVALAARKNEWYVEMISTMDETEILKGVVPFLEELKTRKIKIALGSASKNAQRILNSIGLTAYFDAIIDGTKTTRSKPNPQVFVLGAEALETAYENCVVFEDSLAGLEAAKRGNMFAVGVGEATTLHIADVVIQGFEEYHVDSLMHDMRIKKELI